MNCVGTASRRSLRDPIHVLYNPLAVDRVEQGLANLDVFQRSPRKVEVDDCGFRRIIDESETLNLPLLEASSSPSPARLRA